MTMVVETRYLSLFDTLSTEELGRIALWLSNEPSSEDWALSTPARDIATAIQLSPRFRPALGKEFIGG